MDKVVFDVVKRLRTCIKKKPYATSTIAEKVAERVKNVKLEIYYCPYCNFFHLTHKKKKEKILW